MSLAPGPVDDRPVRGLLGSIALHAGLVIAVLSLGHPERSGNTRGPISIEVVSPVELTSPETRTAAGGDGGSRGGERAALTAPDIKAREPSTADKAPAPTSQHAANLDGPAARSARRAILDGRSSIGASSQRAATVGDLVGPIGFDRGTGNGRGDGKGTGLGAGDGIGDGLGTGRDGLAARLPAPPIADRIESKARPARLIYPSRTADIEEAALFVAQVTVDDEGYVVGAHLTRRFGGRRDDDAASLIFRFRYDPARDDAGRPIASIVEQHFHVGH